jgi:hypothetical protein
MVKTIVTLNTVNDKLTFHEKMVTDISFSKYAKHQIGKHIKGSYNKILSNALNKPIHIYSPQKLLQTLQQTNLLPKLRQALKVASDTQVVTDIQAAKQMVRVFTDQTKPEEVVDKMQHSIAVPAFFSLHEYPV